MGEGRVVRGAPGDFWSAGTDTDSRFEMIVEEVPYLAGPPLHIHEFQEDSFYVLSGTLTAQVGDEVVELQPGDFATAPPGVPHTFTNTDPERVTRMLNVMAPPMGSARLIGAAKFGTADRAELERLRMETYAKLMGPTLPERLGLQ
jgi:mannose-6-phosphate isomerase-like protein (cupin superfamily)